MNNYLFLIFGGLISCASPSMNEKSETTMDSLSFIKPNFDFELKCDGNSPLNQSEYLKHFKIKSYKEIRFLEDGLTYVGGFGSDTVVEGNNAQIIEFKKFDREGNITTDYNYLAEGPLIHRFKYTYNKDNKITKKIELSYHDFPVENYYYSEVGILDSVILSTKYKDGTEFLDGKKFYNSGKEVFLYRDIETGIIDTVKYDNKPAELDIDDKGRIVQWNTEYQCQKYFYNYNLLVRKIHLDERCINEQGETLYEYDNKGLLIKKIVGPNSKLKIIYEYY